MKPSVLILCVACLLMDGFDVQAMGYVAPALIRDWNIPREILGPALSAVLVGVLVGSLGMGMLADKFGRRPILIAGCLWFSVLTLATTQVATLNQLIACRFLAGVGLGGIMPNAVALVGEFSPEIGRVHV